MSSTAREVISIRSVQDVVDAVRQAAADGVTLSAARQAPDAVRQLDLSSFQAVVDYPARDMTITVEAGMPLQKLEDLLRAEGQQLPVDAGDPDMSVGAFVAADHAGPRQYGYGTLRDYLIGVEAVDGRGRVFHAGGRVVKNVAGYDLCRLMTGSEGALGILTQLTLKLKPVPEQFVIHTWQFASGDPVAVALDQLNESRAQPIVLDLEVRQQAAWSLHAGVEGPAKLCDWQLEQLKSEIRNAERSDVTAGDQTMALEYCRRTAAAHFHPQTVAIVRTLPSRVAGICAHLEKSGLTAVCHARNGVILVGRAEADVLSDDDVMSLRQQLSDHGGHLQLSLSGRGIRTGGSPYTAGLIEAFDPDRVFG